MSFRASPTLQQQLVKEPSLASRVRELRRIEASLSDDERWKADLKEALDRAEEALGKTGEIATAYDAVWRALHGARHLLCQHGDATQLIEVASEIRADLVYHPCKKELAEKLDGLVAELSEGACAVASDAEAFLEKMTGELRELPTKEQRLRFLDLSHQAAEDRESQWRRTNRLLDRRKKAADLLWWLLGGAVALLPFVLGKVGRSHDLALLAPGAWTWLRWVLTFGVVLGFGALGGVLSVLMGHATPASTSIDHHLELHTHHLRSRVGAASALILYLIVLAGLIQIQGPGPPELSPLMLILSVLAGFSERLVVGQLDRISKALDTPAKG